MSKPRQLYTFNERIQQGFDGIVAKLGQLYNTTVEIIGGLVLCIIYLITVWAVISIWFDPSYPAHTIVERILTTLCVIFIILPMVGMILKWTIGCLPFILFWVALYGLSCL